MPKSSIYKHAAFDKLHNRLTISGTLVAQTGLRIGAGRSGDIAGSDLPVLRDGLGRIFIPGASLKGAFRARVEGLIRAVAGSGEPDFAPIKTLSRQLREKNADQAAQTALIEKVQPAGAALDLPQLEKRTAAVRELLRANRSLDDRLVDQLIFQSATLIDLTFGSPELAGRLFFRDAPVSIDLAAERVEIRNGVAINRDTETVEGGLLYNYEVVPAGTPFSFTLTLENADDWQLAMVLYALRPWVRGETQVGGFRSRGLGYVKLERATAHYVVVSTVDDVLRLIGAAEGGGATVLDLDALLGGAAPSDPENFPQAIELLKSWTTSFGKVLTKISQEGQHA